MAEHSTPSTNPILRLAIRRFLLILAGSILFVGLGSELAYTTLKQRFEREPETITLTIPNGTALKVAAGVAEPSIPSELEFVVGDSLVIYNDDVVDHEVGPLFIPAGSSARLVMDAASVYEYACSFRPTKYLGLTVREAATLNLRLIVIGYVSPATAIIVFLYSLAAKPIVYRDSQSSNLASQEED
jgi:hypothetical protein